MSHPPTHVHAEPPDFVWATVVSLCFNVVGLDQRLRYRAKGRWADYLVGERRYVILSLMAKALLAWQVSGGRLAGWCRPRL